MIRPRTRPTYTGKSCTNEGMSPRGSIVLVVFVGLSAGSCGGLDRPDAALQTADIPSWTAEADGDYETIPIVVSLEFQTPPSDELVDVFVTGSIEVDAGNDTGAVKASLFQLREQQDEAFPIMLEPEAGFPLRSGGSGDDSSVEIAFRTNQVPAAGASYRVELSVFPSDIDGDGRSELSGDGGWAEVTLR